MDARGNWHEARRDLGRMFEDVANQDRSATPRARFVIELDAGEEVKVMKADGTHVVGKFAVARDNKVTIEPFPVAGHEQPYLETAERIELYRLNGQHVPAQVWDTRGGKVVLRTLPTSL